MTFPALYQHTDGSVYLFMQFVCLIQAILQALVIKFILMNLSGLLTVQS